LHHPEGPIKLKEMDKRQLVSGQYREHLLIHLKTIGLVMSEIGFRRDTFQPFCKIWSNDTRRRRRP
jgi:hypothetical protein